MPRGDAEPSSAGYGRSRMRSASLGAYGFTIQFQMGNSVGCDGVIAVATGRILPAARRSLNSSRTADEWPSNRQGAQLGRLTRGVYFGQPGREATISCLPNVAPADLTNWRTNRPLEI